MSRVLGRFRARRLLPRAMEPPALGFLLPPSERLLSCPVTPASPRLCRSLPSGLPAGTGERPLRRVGVPRGTPGSPGAEQTFTRTLGGSQEPLLAPATLGGVPASQNSSSLPPSWGPDPPRAPARGRQGVRVAGPQPPALRFRLPRSAPGRRSGRRARHSLGPLSSPRPASRCFPRRRPPLHLFMPLNQSPLNAADPSVLCMTLGSLIAVTRLSRRPRGQCWAVFSTPAPLPSASLAHRAPRRPKAYLPPRILPGFRWVCLHTSLAAAR